VGLPVLDRGDVGEGTVEPAVVVPVDPAGGCERIFTDKLCGSATTAPGRAALLDCVRTGDTVITSTGSARGPSRCVWAHP